MKKLAMIAAAMLSVSALSAAELNDISTGDIKAYKIELPAPVLQRNDAGKSGHVTGEITKLHLLARTSKNLLFTHAKTEAEFKEFVDMWTPILGKFGIKVTGTEYNNEFGKLTYESADGRVVRDFTAEKMNYDALSSTSIAALQREVLEPLDQAGMTPVASFTINHEIFRPTFNVYYLTKPEENMDHEIQLRQLKNGDDIEFDLLAGFVNIVKKDRSFSMVYIGKLLGQKGKLGTDEAAIAVKLADYKKFLVENNKEFIASKTYKLEKPIEFTDIKFNYYVNIYFFQ
ncbi:MAG: hypothetical protein COX65_09770 [Elusimicrobia bacterium CG_4_10_14_0_2_um_filter_56_8]|nr:MAG: hypothetical protein COX65_09770 [Elusimicrobia bacterium CG_4_10_14_0_2_um_filter_56_8]